jgi:Tfp pilus assembly protein PilX
MQHANKQKGILLLATSLVLLLVMGIFALMLELKSVQGFKVSLQNLRGEQALNAAEAGLNYGVAYVIETPTGATAPNSTAIATTTINTQLGSDVGQVISITSSEQSTYVYKIVATGQSADGTVRKTLEHIINVSPQNPSASGYDITGWKDY